MKQKMDQATFDRLVESVRPLVRCPEDRERTAQDIAAYFFPDRPSPFLEPTPRLGARFLASDTLLQKLINASRKHQASWDALVEIARGRLMIELRSSPKDPVWALLKTSPSRMPRLTLLKDPLIDWIVDVLGDQLLRDKKEQRRPRPGDRGRRVNRDELICFVISVLVEREDDLFATRSGGRRECCAEGGSACDIVGAAVNLERKQVDPGCQDLLYCNFERIWREGQGQFDQSRDRESPE